MNTSRLEGMKARGSLAKHVTSAKAGSEQISVPAGKTALFVAEGWEVIRSGKTRVRMGRNLPSHRRFELKVWYMCYLLGFDFLSDLSGATLHRPAGSLNQIDVIAQSDDLTLLIECKSGTATGSRAFDANVDVPKLHDIVQETRKVLRSEGSGAGKVKGIFCLSGIRRTKADNNRLTDNRQKALDESIIDYYILLAEKIGPIAYYQFLGEVIGDEEIQTLKDIKVPCVRMKFGSATAYQIALTPAILLKLAYVSHRMNASGGGYQRMVSKNRIKEMHNFIDQGGYFPTNIVINFRADSTRLIFEPAPGEYTGVSDVKFGMLKLPANYACAFVIDGQHRLLSYAGHRWEETAVLPVTAFDGLPREKEAELFEDINSKQKKVSAALLVELYGLLHMGNPDIRFQIKAMSSSVVEKLGSDRSSPLFQRILGSDDKSTLTKCVTLKQFSEALGAPGYFHWKLNAHKMQVGGPFWLGDPHQSVERAVDILTHWFETVRNGAEAEWDMGLHGIVATNRGVAACLRVLRDVFLRLRQQDPDFESWSESKIKDVVEPFALVCGESFKALRLTEFEAARTSYGAGATREYHFTIVKYIRSEGWPDFQSEGFEEWSAEKASVNVADASALVQEIERGLGTFIRRELERPPAEGWSGVPQNVRKEAASRREEDANPLDPWHYLQLIDYRTIIQKNWQLFRDRLAMENQGKEDGTKWLVELNEIRKACFHAGGARLRSDQVSALREIAKALQDKEVF